MCTSDVCPGNVCLIITTDFKPLFYHPRKLTAYRNKYGNMSKYTAAEWEKKRSQCNKNFLFEKTFYNKSFVAMNVKYIFQTFQMSLCILRGNIFFHLEF